MFQTTNQSLNSHHHGLLNVPIASQGVAQRHHRIFHTWASNAVLGSNGVAYAKNGAEYGNLRTQNVIDSIGIHLRNIVLRGIYIQMVLLHYCEDYQNTIKYQALAGVSVEHSTV